MARRARKGRGGRAQLAESLLTVSSRMKRTAQQLLTGTVEESPNDSGNRRDASATSEAETESGSGESSHTVPLADPQETVARADRIYRSKRTKTRGRGKGRGSSSVSRAPDNCSITVCTMSENRRGNFVRDGNFVEVHVKRSDSYISVIKKSAKALKTNAEGAKLFKIMGAQIQDEPITLEGDVVMWTIGHYMRLRHIKPDNLKIGVGTPQVDLTISNSSSSDEEEKVKEPEGVVQQSNAVTQPDVSPSAQPVVQEPMCTTGAMKFSGSEIAQTTWTAIGSGGFGEVFLGVLRHTTVAAKFLSDEGMKAVVRKNKNPLQTELSALTKFRHPNLVPLMGFSIDPPVIVYQYMAGLSLYHNLHEVEKPLTWEGRQQILVDTCAGLAYLHTAEPPLVHQDVKTQNILIDEHGRGRIGDFGFSIELPKVDEGGRSTYTAMGGYPRSEGYYPSEVTHGRFSDRSDVYSYGVVVLETFTGLKAYSTERPDRKLVEHCDESLDGLDLFQALSDRRLPICPKELAYVMRSVVVTCLVKHSKRPTSAEVLDMWQL